MEEPMNDRPSFRRRFFVGLWDFVNGLFRLFFNVLFIALLTALAVAAWNARPRVPATAALVLDPKGVIVEQLSAEPAHRAVSQLVGASSLSTETLLKDVLDAIRLAKDDGRIKALVLDVDDMTSAGMSKLLELREALLDFKKSGKKVVAYADNYTQAPYYLAALADEVAVHPQGSVLLEGFGGYRQFYKEAEDKFGVEMHVFRVGEYKSAVEPYLRKDMSPETREQLLDVYGDLWRTWLAGVGEARKLSPEAVQGFIDGLPERMKATKGDLPLAAREAHLVDEVKHRDLVRKRLIELVGEDKEAKTFRQVRMAVFLAAHAGDRDPRATARGPGVGVIVAKGEILDGTQPPGVIGGDSTAALIRKARQDDDMKALVLRVDSPGGSVFASEVIRRELELAREAGKPVVVSMSSVAASGGYWISTASDEIWASPATITGSIGIFGVFPDVSKTLTKYLGIHVDGVGTTRFTDAMRPDRPLEPAVAETVQTWINHGYEEFLERVAKARKMSRDEVDKIARGRIWSGEDAQKIGLVDKLGGLPQAIDSAAKRAKLAPNYRVATFEQEVSLRQRLLRSFGALSPEEPGPARPAPVVRSLVAVEDALARVARWNDPRGLYAHCLCGEER
jgi:protease IV